MNVVRSVHSRGYEANRTPPTDLTDEQWELLKPMLPPDKPRGRKRRVDLRDILNAILYLLRSGCSWRMLPHDFPPWQTVYGYFYRWRDSELFTHLNATPGSSPGQALREQVRLAQGRPASPSAAIIDSQSVKTTEQGGQRGYDAGKKINGRKRHIVVDTMGLFLGLWFIAPVCRACPELDSGTVMAPGWFWLRSAGASVVWP